MSSIGSNIAAGVAQTGLNAQQTSRAQDARKAQQTERAKRQKEDFESHLQAIEEGEEVDRLYIDGQVPEHENDGKKRRDQEQEQQAPSADQPTAEHDEPQPRLKLDVMADESNAANTPPGNKPDEKSPHQPLYKHLDISA